MTSLDVTNATISNSLPLFIRNILRQNLTDTQSTPRAGTAWIFKGQPEDLDFDPPIVFTDESSFPQRSGNMAGSKRQLIEGTVTIWVWAKKIGDRDVLTDRIDEIIWDRDSADSDSNTINTQRLVLLESTPSVRDGMVTKYPKIVRKMMIITKWRYDGG